MIHIDNVIIEASAITFEQMQFGRDANSLPHSSFAITMSCANFLSSMSAAYEDCIEELRRDDVITGTFDPPYPNAHDYPSLKDFINVDIDHFFRFFLTFLKYDFLRLILVEENPSASFLIVKFESLDVINDVLTFRGKARRLKQ